MAGWLDGVGALVAYAATIVATLRAGSRAIFLAEHHQIGVMQGPLITRPTDGQPSQLWDLAYAFQQSVALAQKPQSFDYRFESILEEVPEPYSLSPFPGRAKRKSASEDGTELVESSDQIPEVEDKNYLDDYIDQVISVSERKHPLNRFFGIPTLLSKQSSPKLQLRNQVWRQPEAHGEDIEEEEGWDYDTLLTARISFNGTQDENQGGILGVYSPETFADLRSRFGVSEADFSRSIFGSGSFVSFQSNSKGAARVGGVFFFSRNGAYMIKTIKKEEAKRFLEMLPKYHRYMRRNQHRSLLTRFCGMYSVTMEERSPRSGEIRSGKERIFLVMNSVFPAEASMFISQRFDLKGSTVGRECSEEEKLKKGSLAVLKDLDLAREVELVRSLENIRSKRKEDYGFHIGPTAKAALLSQLRKDVRFLEDCQVMDYSLLVGVVNMDSGKLDVGSLEAMVRGQLEEDKMYQSRKGQRRRSLLNTIAAPLRILSAPLVFVGRRGYATLEGTMSSILTLPLPYYGAGLNGVNGGPLSVIEGRRNGNRAIFYFGLIDFLQPWTARKVMERRLKGALGYDIHAISSVDPTEYASRFLEFIEGHVT